MVSPCRQTVKYGFIKGNKEQDRIRQEYAEDHFSNEDGCVCKAS